MAETHLGARTTLPLQWNMSGKTFARDVFSVAGNTTLPSYQAAAEEEDSFASSMETTWASEQLEAMETRSAKTSWT